MSIKDQHRIDPSKSAGNTDSSIRKAPGRAVGIASLRRIGYTVKGAVAAIFNRNRSDECDVRANLDRMQSPVFEEAARELEKSIGEQPGFGRFKEGPR